MRRSAALLGGVLAVAVAPAAAQPVVAAPGSVAAAARVKLQIGTEVPLILDETLSSQRNVKGDLVHLTVARDVIADGKIIIAKGTRAVGELTRAERKSGLGVAGKLEAQLLYLERNGDVLRLSGRLAARGEGNTTQAMLTAAAAGGIALVITGKSAIIPAGTAMTAYLDHDAWITAP